MLGYIIVLSGAFIYLVVGTILLIKHPFKLSKLQSIIFGIVISLLYLYPLIEAITTWTFESENVQMLLPTYNIIPFAIIFTIVSCFVEGKFKQILNVIISLLTPIILFGLFRFGIYLANTSVIFYERNGLYIFCMLLVSMYGIYNFINEEENFSLKNLLIFLGIICFIYIFMNIHNIGYNTSFFGLTLNDDAYFIHKINFKYGILTLIFNYLLVISSMIIMYFSRKLFKSKILSWFRII